MINQIPFHEYDFESCREDIGYETERVQKDLVNISSPDYPNLTLARVAKDSISYAGLVSQFRPCSYDLCNAHRLAAWALEGSFRLARHPRGEQRLEIFLPPAEPFMMTTTGPSGATNAVSWIKAFHLNMINREKGNLDSLCLYPTDLLREANNHGVHVGEYAYAQVDMLKAFWLDDPNIQNIAIEALRVASDVNTLGEDIIDYALNIASYEISLFIQAHMQQEDFTEQLTEAVEMHKKHFFIGQDKLLEDSRYFLALGPIAMSVLALERGLSIEVESDYIPRCVIEDKYEHHPESVPLLMY
jgi:Immunity protein 49